MSLPTVTKTWQYAVNQMRGNQTSYSLCATDIIFGLKQTLKGLTYGGASLGWTNPWTVTSSADATTLGNNDGIDRWTSISTIPAWGSARAWLVLRSVNGSEVCLYLNSALSPVGSAITVVFSPVAGFGLANGGVNGTASARPTATDEVVLFSAANWGTPSASSPFASRLHVMMSSDGLCTRFFLQNSRTTNMMAVFDRVKNPISSWTTPNFGMWVGTSTVSADMASLSLIASNVYRFFGRIGSVNATMTLATEGLASEWILNQTFTNEVSQEWTLTPLSLVSEAATMRGRHGEIFDLWTISNSLFDGLTLPADGSMQFCIFGDFAVPWNGSNPLVFG